MPHHEPGRNSVCGFRVQVFGEGGLGCSFRRRFRFRLDTVFTCWVVFRLSALGTV